MLRFFTLLSLTRQLARSAGVTNIRNAAFVEPDECSSTTTCKLTLEAVKYDGPGVSFSTRGYNGHVPGPTMRVSPGSNLFVDFTNALEDIDNRAIVADINSPQLLNTTNLHTHGLHTSPRAPGDDVMARIDPGESRLFDFEVN